MPGSYVIVGALIVLLAVSIVLFMRSVSTLAPGWKYELWAGGKLVKVLDQPGFYMVSPFVQVRRVRTDDPRVGPK